MTCKIEEITIAVPNGLDNRSLPFVHHLYENRKALARPRCSRVITLAVENKGIKAVLTSSKTICVFCYEELWVILYADYICANSKGHPTFIHVQLD